MENGKWRIHFQFLTCIFICFAVYAFRLCVKMNKREVVARILMSCMWEVTFAVFSIVQKAIWLLNGTYFGLLKNREPQNYGHSAQVLRIISRFRFEEYFPYTKHSCFLLSHVGFDSPERVLQDHVSLFRLTEDEAVFVEASPGTEAWRARYSAFFYRAQFYEAIHVVKMPITSFHHLANQLPDPRQLVYLNCTARCGSSLLTQMFESTGKLVAFAEPPITHDLADLQKKIADEDDVNRLIVSTIRLLCKPTSLKELGYVLKVIPLDAHLTPKFLTLFPRAKCIFMYRDGLKVSQSFYRVLQQQMIPKAAEILKWSPRFHRWVTGYPDISSMSKKMSSVSLTNIMALSTAIWATAIDEYVEFRNAGLPMVAVRYEDIVADPESNMQRILSYCELPEELAVDACRAMESDCQKDTPLSGSKLRQIPTMEYDGVARDAVDTVCDAFGLPRFSEAAYIAPGTITSTTVQ